MSTGQGGGGEEDTTTQNLDITYFFEQNEAKFF